MAVDLKRIKSNVSKMVEMGAPEEEIDEYITAEGATVDQIRDFKGRAEPGSWQYALQGAGALPEALLRGAAGLGAQAAGGLVGLAEGGLEGAAKKSQEWTKAVQDVPTLFAPTKDFEEHILGPLGEMGKDLYGRGVEQLARNPMLPMDPWKVADPVLPQDFKHKREAGARTLGEVAFDAALVGVPGTAANRAVKKRLAGDTTPTPTPDQPAPIIKGGGEGPKGQLEFDFMQEQALDRGAQTMQARREAAQGELATIVEQQRFLERELGNRQPDLFPETGLERRGEGLERRAPTPEIAPIPFERAQYTPEGFPDQFGRSVAGMDDTTSAGVRPTPDMPAIEFQPSGMPAMRPHAFEKSGWQHADPRVAEALSRDSILKGMQTRLEKTERLIERMKDQRGGMHAEYGDRRVRGQVGARRAQEMHYLTRSIKAVERDAAKIREQIERRIAKTETRVKSQPIIERTGRPSVGRDQRPTSINVEHTFQGPKGRGRRQGGYIDPAIIRDGVTALIRKLGSLKAAAKFAGTYNPSTLARAIGNSRDPKSRETLVWMRPFDFLRLAAGRLNDPTIQKHSEAKRRSIRKGFDTEEGLSDIPYLLTERNDNLQTYKVVGHEGRHRMDVFNEKGIELVPVRLIDSSTRWGTSNSPLPSENYRPYRWLQGEGSTGSRIPFPEFVNSEIKTPTQVPMSQRGSVSKDLLTLGLSKIIDGAIKKKEQKNTAKMESTKSRNEIIEAATGETRSWNEVKGELLSDVKDLPDTTTTKSFQYFSNAQMLYHHTKNEVVKYIGNRVANEKSLAGLKSDLALTGVNLEARGLILPKQVIDPKSSHAVWHGLTRSEKKLATDIMNKHSADMEATPESMRALGATDRVINALEILQKPLKDFIKELNNELIKAGRQPLKEKPFYFMRAAGSGNFLVRAVKQVGETKDGKPIYDTVAFHRTHTKWEADRIIEGWRERFGSEGLEFQRDVANPRTQGNRFNVSPMLLEDIYQALERNDPRRQALASAAAEISSKAGAMHHRAWRKGREGMDLDPKNFWKTYEGYINDGYNYISNMHLGELMKQIQMTTDMPPRLKQWALDYLNLSRGGGEPREVLKALENGIDNVLNSLSGGQIAPGMTREIVRYGNRLFTSQALFWGQIPFMVGQALQSHAFAPAILAQYKYNMKGYDKGSIVKSMATGPLHLFTRGKEFESVVDFLSARGKIEPNLIKDFAFFGDTKSRMRTAWSWFPEFSAVPRKIEGLNRMHAASIAYDFLKDNGYRGKELKIGVERMVDDIMGNYSLSDRPGAVTRHGVVGEAISPLLTFKNWFTGVAVVMAKEAARGSLTGNWKAATPFAALATSTLIFGGLTGMIAMKEMDAIWNWLKSQTWFQELTGWNETTPSLTEAILTSGLPDAGKFGAITGMTTMIDPRGAHISGSMAAPEFMPSFASHGMGALVPGVAKLGNYATGLPALTLDTLDISNLTEQERKQIVKGMIPNSWAKVLDNIDTQAGTLGFEGRPVPSGQRGFGGVRREDAWEIGASILGSGTIPEYSKKAATRDIKDTRAYITDRRVAIVDKAVDALMAGESIAEYVAQARAIGMTDFASAVKQAYINRLREEGDRLTGTGRTPDQIRKRTYIKRAEGQ